MAEKTWQIGGMDCAHCALEVENGVKKLDGVNSVQVDFASGKMVLEGNVPFDVLQARVESLGKTIQDEADKSAEAFTPSRGGLIGFWDYLAERHDSRLALIAGGVILVTLITSLLIPLPELLTNSVYTVAMLIALYPIAKSGINTLLINHSFNINLLMTIAGVGAILIGEHLEAATVVFLFAIGEAMEGYTADRARQSIRSLLTLKPNHATVLHGDLTELVPVEALSIGDRILVKPGERIPMDGEIISGSGGVNQAPITGESIPVHKTVGDRVFAGTINSESALTIRVTHLAEDNTLNHIIKMVEEAQSVRAPSQRMIDRFAQYYTPSVVILATIVAIVPPLLFSQSFWGTGGWLYRALIMLVIACPCALVISTPVTVISAIAGAARRGVLIKGGAHLEALGKVTAFAFDKTGTLTQGKPAVTSMRAVECYNPEDDCDNCRDVLALAAAVEQRSTHPLAAAVVHAAEERHLMTAYQPAESVMALAGRGVQGMVDGHMVTIGSHRLFDEQYPHSAEFCGWVKDAEQEGKTTMLLNDGGRVRGFIALADEPREDSQQVIDALHKLHAKAIMLTGDNQTVAKAIGEQIGVDDIRAELLPEDKVNAVTKLKADYGDVAMVGDGINDTPALAAATVGIAMGGAGSHQAMETADIVLMADDIKQLPFAVQLSRFARGLIRQNIALSLVMKGLFLLLAVIGGVSMWAAIFADVGMLLIVTLNGMRPLRRTHER